MAHPLKSDTNASRAAKLRRMTEHYGEADKKDMQYAGVNKFKIEGPEDAIGFGADSDRPSLHGARRVRKPAGGNAFATYKRGGRVHHRASGGDTSDIEQADIDQKLDRKHGGRVRHRDAGGAAMAGERPVKMGAKYATVSSEPSPTPVDNRARGGRTGGKKKSGTHVNIMIAPQHGQPGAAGPMPVSAMPTPPPMPHPGGPPPPGGMPGMPPGAGPPPGGLPVLPPGAAPPGAVPPGLAARPPMMPPPRKRGGRVMAKKHHHSDAHEDAAMIKSMVRESALKPHGSMRAAGGRIGLTAGAYSGEGRLEKARSIRKVTHATPQKV